MRLFHILTVVHGTLLLREGSSGTHLQIFLSIDIVLYERQLTATLYAVNKSIPHKLSTW